MKDSTSYKVGSNLAVLLVGPPKSGKTGIAASFPNPFIADIDLNLDSAARIIGTKTFKYSQPPLEFVPKATYGPDDPRSVYDFTMRELQMAAKDPWVKTIIIDGLTKLSDFAIEHILADCSRMEGKKIEAMRIQDYGRFMSLYQKLVSFLRATGKHIVCTAHQTVSKDELTGANQYALAIPGQLKDTFGGFFTDVWGSSATPAAQGKTKFEIRTRPTGFHVALGTSIRTLDHAIDITDKNPEQIWAILAPKLGLPVV